MFRIVLLVVALALLAGCSGQRESAATLHIYTAANEAGELWVTVNDGEPQRLLSEAQGYRPLVSPNGNWLAVEVRLLSNLEIVRVFRRDDLQFVAASKDVVTNAWRQTAADQRMDPEAFDGARTRIAGWSDDGNALQLEFSALLPNSDDEFQTSISIPLDVDDQH